MPRQKKVKYELAESVEAPKAEAQTPVAEQAVAIDEPLKRGRGRPKGSKNKPKIILAAVTMEQPPVVESEEEARRRELAAKAMNLGELKKEKPLSPEEMLNLAAEKRKAAMESAEKTEKELEIYKRELGEKGAEKLADIQWEKYQKAKKTKEAAEQRAKDEEKIKWHQEQVILRRKAKEKRLVEEKAAAEEKIAAEEAQKKAEQKAKIAQFKARIEEGKKARQEARERQGRHEETPPEPEKRLGQPTPEEIDKQRGYHDFIKEKLSRVEEAEKPAPEVLLPPPPPMKKLGLWQRARQLGSAIWEDIRRTWNRGRPDKRNK